MITQVQYKKVLQQYNIMDNCNRNKRLNFSNFLQCILEQLMLLKHQLQLVLANIFYNNWDGFLILEFGNQDFLIFVLLNRTKSYN